MTPNTRLHAPHRTSHPRPPPPRPPPRLGGKGMRRWNSPKEEPQTRMGGFSCAPRCPASLTFRDSPALVRQESDGYPVRPGAATPTPTSHSPLLDPSSNSSAPTSRPTLGLRPARPCPSPPRAHIPTRTYKTNPASCSQKKRKNGKEETSGGDSPPMQHPREGLPSPKLCLSITPKPAAAQGALGAACRTAAARG